jgi:DNA-binding transcriptional LysR family regulator
MSGRSIPSLSALRSFEVLARTMSFTRAAEELGVTQAAISRQIRILEDHLSVKLIERRPGSVSHLTDAGEILFDGLSIGFLSITEAVNQIAGSEDRKILNVGVPPFFSSQWLTPRLYRFISAHPDIELRLSHSYQAADHRRERIDIDVSWGSMKRAGTVREKLVDGALVPVATPHFISGNDIKRPSDLLRLPLFHEFSTAHWEAWFANCGVEAPLKIPSLRLNDSHALLRMATDGHGVALFFSSLVEREVASGQLARVFAETVHVGSDFHLGYPASMELTAKAKVFRRFLLAEALGAAEQGPYDK